MTDNPQYANPNQNHKGTRPTIGLLTRKISYSWALSQVQGMLEACRERNVNLVCFPGGHLLNLEELDTQGNILYDLAIGGEFDGFIILSSAIVAGLGQNELEDFYKRFYPRPIVNIELSLPGIPVVFKSEYEAMREILRHLTEGHGYRRIAYISREGSNNPGHLARYQAYLDTLAEYNVPFDPNLVFYSKTLSELDERKLRPGIDFEALAANEDEYALAALQALQARGIRVPEEVAIIGFDDLAESWAVLPPLTTVKPPFHEMGYKAVEMLLALLADEEVSEQVTLPSQLVIRQSCGCMITAEVAGAGSEVSTVRLDPEAAQANGETLDTVLSAYRGDIVAEMAQMVSPKKPNPDRMGQLLDGFVAEIKDQSPGLFLRELNEILRQVEAAGGEVRLWQNGLSVLRRWLRPCFDDGAFALADNLWQQGRVLIGEVAEQAQAYQSVLAEQRAQLLREVSQDLITTFDVAGLMDILAESLPRLDFPSGYLALYEMPQPYQYPQPDLGWSRLVLAYDERGRVELEADGRRFPSCQLLPAGMWPDRQFSFMVEPLYFRDDQLGFALFEMGPHTGSLYEALRGQISSALKGALLVQQEEKRTRQLQTVTEVSAAASTILNMTELLQNVVDLTKASFDLYHAHVYLLNEAGDTLQLAAGAGEVGRQMVAQGWQISLSADKSLVTRAARTRQGIIVNNVREDPGFLSNPLLPDTQSELAVPLIVGERILGVLDVQSDEVGYFTQDDIRIQTTLATQIVVTLENARLFERTRAALAETEAMYQTSRRINEANNLQEVIAAIAGSGSDINRAVLYTFELGAAGHIETLNVKANWHNSQKLLPPPLEARFAATAIPHLDLLVSAEAAFSDDVLHDERLDFEVLTAMHQTHGHAVAILPLWVSSRQVGVLLLETENKHRFTQHEQRLYTSLAGQVAVAVENQRLLAETQAVLTELEATQRRYTLQAWETYRAKNRALSYEQARESLSSLQNTLPAEGDSQAISPQQAISATDGDKSRQLLASGSTSDLPPLEVKSSFSVPLTVRGEIIGELGLQETDADHQWSPEEAALVEAIAQQVAQAAENLRLIDETQQRAARERRVAEIGDRIRGAQSLEDALQIAVKEIGLSLKAQQTAVQLKVLD